MGRPTKGNERKVLIGDKLETLRKNITKDIFLQWFRVSTATYSRFLNGDSSPTIAQLWDLALNYAAAHDMKIVDFNWLANDNDRRLGPVFVCEAQKKTSAGFATEGKERLAEIIRVCGVIQEQLGVVVQELSGGAVSEQDLERADLLSTVSRLQSLTKQLQGGLQSRDRLRHQQNQGA